MLNVQKHASAYLIGSPRNLLNSFSNNIEYGRNVKMKKKSLFDIVMEQKREKQNSKNNIFITKKNSKISIIVEMI